MKTLIATADPDRERLLQIIAGLLRQRLDHLTRCPWGRCPPDCQDGPLQDALRAFAYYAPCGCSCHDGDEPFDDATGSSSSS